MKKYLPINSWHFIRVVIVAGMILTGVGAVSACVDVFHEKSEATRFVAVLSKIQVGVTTENDAISAARPFAGYEDTRPSPHDQSVAIGTTYTFRNRIMAILHLAPPKYLYAGLEFKDGIVIGKSINFFQQPRYGVVVKEVMASRRSDLANTNARQLNTNAYGPGLIVISVHDDTSVPLRRRQLDWEIDLTCLARIGSCETPQTMLPGIFPQKP